MTSIVIPGIVAQSSAWVGSANEFRHLVILVNHLLELSFHVVTLNNKVLNLLETVF